MPQPYACATILNQVPREGQLSRGLLLSQPQVEGGTCAVQSHPIDSWLVHAAGSQRNGGLGQDGFNRSLQPALPCLGTDVSPGLSHAYLSFPHACSGDA